MGTKTLSISEDAYDKLSKLKRQGESFSQVILRLTDRRGDPDLILETVERLNRKDREGSQQLADEVEHVYRRRKTVK